MELDSEIIDVQDILSTYGKCIPTRRGRPMPTQALLKAYSRYTQRNVLALSQAHEEQENAILVAEYLEEQALQEILAELSGK